jgi:hypothetical protein
MFCSFTKCYDKSVCGKTMGSAWMCLEGKPCRCSVKGRVQGAWERCHVRPCCECTELSLNAHHTTASRWPPLGDAWGFHGNIKQVLTRNWTSALMLNSCHPQVTNWNYIGFEYALWLYCFNFITLIYSASLKYSNN